MRARRMSSMLWVTSSGLRGSAINEARVLAISSDCSTPASSITPPSEVMRPPSNAAATFLRPTAGILNGSSVSSDMAGVARVVAGIDWSRHPILKHNQYLTRHPPANPCHAMNKIGLGYLGALAIRREEATRQQEGDVGNE